MPKTMTDHLLTRDFSASEFLCKHCGKAGIHQSFVEHLQQLRDALSVPIRITSGYRCTQHPVELAKVKPGQHPNGIAADITGPPLLTIWRALINFPVFTGIGVAIHQNYMHLDTRLLPHGGRVVWSYNHAGVDVKWSGRWEELKDV